MADLVRNLDPDLVGTVEILRPPNNFLDAALLEDLGAAYRALEDDGCRAIVLCSVGKHFSAGVDHDGGVDRPRPSEGSRFTNAVAELFAVHVPVVAAVQGAAVGGGLGLACAADFRVATPTSRFVAGFVRLGLHQGFALSATLPRLVGQQRAAELLLLTGTPVAGVEAQRIGLCDRLVEPSELRAAATAFATELAAGAPLATRSIRATLRADVDFAIGAIIEHELTEQTRLRATADFAEGVQAVAQRRPPRFLGR